MMKGVALFVLVAACSRPPAASAPVPAKGRESPQALAERTAVETAPGGVVFSGDRERRALASLYSDQNLVIIFYRGHW